MGQITASRWTTRAGWDDVPHIPEDEKTRLLASTLPYLRDARSKGTPSQGSGAIYPVEESVFLVDPFPIPAYWPRAFGLDVGWRRTAAIWGAHDRDTDTVYLYTEHYRAEAEPSIHAAAIRARGEWIPGVIDPAARARAQKDGEQLIVSYRELGLDVAPAINSREAGLQAVWDRLSIGKLKVLKTCTNWRQEHRQYHRDEKGKIVKEDDHLMDAMRYLIISGLKRERCQPVQKSNRVQPGIIDPLIAY